MEPHQFTHHLYAETVQKVSKQGCHEPPPAEELTTHKLIDSTTQRLIDILGFFNAESLSAQITK